MLSRWRRKIAGFLAVTMIAGQIAQGPSGVVYAAESSVATPSEESVFATSSETDGTATPSETATGSDLFNGDTVILEVNASQIDSALKAGKELDKNKIPYEGDGKEGVYRALKDALTGKSIVLQERLEGEDSGVMYLLAVSRDGDNKDLKERLDLIVINSDRSREYTFFVRITDKAIKLQEGKLEQYEVSYEEPEDGSDQTVAISRHEAAFVAAPGEEIGEEPDGEIGEEPENNGEEPETGLKDFFTDTGVIGSDGNEEIITEVDLSKEGESELTEADLLALMGNEEAGDEYAIYREDDSSFFEKLFRSGNSGKLIGYSLSAGSGITVLSVRSGEPETVFDYGESLYGDGAAEKKAIADASVEMLKAGGIQTGEELDIRITYTPISAPVWGESGEKPSAIYNKITDPYVIIKLPEQITLKECTPESAGTYRIELEDFDSIQKGRTIIIKAYISGNGSRAVGETFDFDPMDCSYGGTITIVDKDGNPDPNGGGRYTITGPLQNTEGSSFTLTTDDQWGVTKNIKKTPQGGNWEIVTDTDGSRQVKLVYEITVGLEGTDGLLTNEAEYYRKGRVPFADFTLTDTLEAAGRNGDEVTPEKIKIWKLDKNQQAVAENEEPDHTVTDSSTIELSDYNCSGTSESGKVETSDEAPFLTRYEVAAYYSYEAFEINQWDEAADKDDQFPVKNTASLTYRLKGGTDAEDEADVTVPVKFLKNMAALKITKQIRVPQFSTGDQGYTEKIYDADMGEDFPGYAAFTIKKNGEPYTGAYLETEEGRYTLIENGTVFINPYSDDEDKDENDNEIPVIGTDGSEVILVEPGTYTIEEIHAPEGTAIPAEKDEKSKTCSVTATDTPENPVAVTFTNEAPEVGGLVFTKKGTVTGSTAVQALAGAEFGIWKADAVEPYTRENAVTTAESGTDGKVEFYPLDKGNYIVKELTAPSGYMLDLNEYTVTIEGNKIAYSLTRDGYSVTELVNEKNEGTLTFTKYVKTESGRNTDILYYEAVSGDAASDFAGVFTLQRRVGNSRDWEDVSGITVALSDENGTFTAKVPVYANPDVGIGSDNKYQYRVVETVPDGYTAEAIPVYQTFDAEASTVTTEAASFIGSNGNYSVFVKAYNIPLGTLSLIKYQSRFNGTSRTDTGLAGRIFRLYKENGSGYEPVKNPDGTSIEVTTAGGGNGSVNVPIWDDEGNAIAYYWYEVNKEDNEAFYSYDQVYGAEAVFKNVSVASLPDGTTNATLAGPFYGAGKMTANDDDQSKMYAYDLVQQFPLWIRKIDGITKGEISGAEFAVYDITEKTEPIDFSELEPVNGMGTLSANGNTPILLDVGKKYAIRETKAPDNYYGFDENGKEYRTVDLTGKTVTMDMTVNNGLEVSENGNRVTFANIPYPKLKVIKMQYDQGNGSTNPAVLTNVRFEVYDSEFEPVKAADGNTLTITAGTPVSLPDGIYYLKEILPDGILDPAGYLTGGSGNGWVRHDEEIYWTVTLETPEDEDNLAAIQITVDNYKNSGSVKFTKINGWTNQTLEGATFTLYEQVTDLTGETTWQEVKEGTSFTFSNLPIKDDDGNYILYKIEETTAPAGYDLDTSYYTFNLSKDGVVETGTHYVLNENGEYEEVDGEQNIQFTDNPLISLSTHKYGKDLWQSEFYAEMKYELPGVQLALFQKVWDGDADDYRIVPVLGADGPPMVEVTSEDWARVSFENLPPRGTYYITEVYLANDGEGDDYRLPEGKEPLLTEGSNETAVSDTKAQLKNLKFSETDFEKYYSIEFATENISEANKEQEKTAFALDDMINEKGWIQLEINKKNSEYAAEKVEKDVYDNYSSDLKFEVNGSYYILKEQTNYIEKALNGARFDLYVTDLPESGKELEKPNFSELTPVGTYESGTLLNEDGNVIDGLLRTDIFHDTSKVYWLVETKAPIGYVSDPAKSTVAFVPEDSEWADDESDEFVITSYSGDGIQSYDVPNYPLTGDGGSYYMSLLKLNKWLKMGEGNEESDYTPLGGVTFGLYIKGYEDFGSLDEMTTGLENNFEGTITASAMSRYFHYTELREQFKKWLMDSGKAADEGAAETIADQVFGITAENTDPTLDCVLKELSAPQKVETEQDSYEVTLQFKDVNTSGIDQEDYTNKKYFYVENNGWNAKRIVNVLREQYPVTVTKYGYVATDEVLEQNPSDEDLDQMEALPGKTALSGVTFTLYRKNTEGTWELYKLDDAPDGTFTTDTNGQFTFSKGLPMGEYRLKENSISGYYQLYNGVNNGRYRYFTVTSEGARVNVYNPKLLDLEVTKGLLNGAGSTGISYEGIKFKLNSQEKTIPSGQSSVTFNGLQPGSYTLSESAADTGKNTTNQYFDKYNTTSIVLGYEPKFDSVNNRVYLTKRTNALSVTDGTAKASLSVKNPKTGSLQITKTDGNSNQPIENVTFTYQWASFRDSDFEGPNGQKHLKSLETLQEMLQDSTQLAAIQKLSYSGNGTMITDADGFVRADHLVPGWYKITETTGADGYTANKKTYYAAVTGDMASKDGSYFHQNSDNPAAVSVENYQKTDITVTKILDYGNLDRTKLDEEEKYPETAEFTLYEGTAAETAVSAGKSFSKNGDDFAASAASTATPSVIYAFGEGLDQLIEANGLENRHYYIKETITPGTTRQKWFFTEGKVENAEEEKNLTSDDLTANGLLSIDTDKIFHSPDPVTVTLTNRINAAQIQIRKVNAADRTQTLPGAVFKAYDNVACTGTPLAEGTTDENGICELTVWLTTNNADEEQIIYIREEKAPEHYVLDNAVFMVDVKAGDRVTWETDGNLIRENVPGIDIELTKYTNTYDALFGEEPSVSEPQNQIMPSGATFELYVRNEGATDTPWTKVTAGDGIAISNNGAVVNGKVSWTGLPISGKQYALYEQEITSGTYKNYTLDSVHRLDKNGDPEEVFLTKLENQSIEGSAETKDLYLLTDGTIAAGAAYGFAAFNRPAEKIRIRKYGLLDENQTAPRAEFKIEDITDPGNPVTVVESISTGETIHLDNQQDGRKYTQTDEIPLKAGKYRITETKSLTDGYYIVKSDSRAVWTQDVELPTDGTIFKFTDLKPVQTLSLSKTATSSNLESLWWTDEQTIDYEIAPAVENDLPLTNFTLKDTGLTMYGSDGGTGYNPLTDSAYTEEKYTLAFLRIPVPTADNSYISDGSGTGGALFNGEKVPAEIEATVTLKGFGENETETIQLETEDRQTDGESAYWQVNLEGISWKIKTFEITYLDSELYKESKNTYSLGHDFDPGVIQAQYTVYRQATETSQEEPAEQITKIVNTAEAQMNYDTYGESGEATAVSQNRSDTDDVLVKEPEVPTVQLTKGVKKKGESAGGTIYVTKGDTLTYTLTLTNISTNQASMDDPLFLDKLPVGVTVAEVNADSIQVDAGNAAVTPDRTAAFTFRGADGSQYLYLPFNGSLKPGEAITISYDAEVQAGIINNAGAVSNEVYVTTKAKGASFTGNPGGAVFKTDTHIWPNMLGQAVEQDVIEKLPSFAGRGWASSYADVTYQKAESVEVLKEQKGDLDEIFTSGDVSAKASLKDGWVRYRLTALNSNTEGSVNGIRMMDIIPAAGDQNLDNNQRYSSWALKVPNLTADADNLQVTKTNTDGTTDNVTDQVTVYYGTEDSYSKEGFRNTGDTPLENQGWTTEYPEKDEITAVLFDAEGITLMPDERITVEFRTDVQTFTNQEEENALYSYATNDYSLRYVQNDRVQNVLTSNPVSAFLIPEMVKVGGRIWIDADNDGIQDADEAYLDSEVTRLSDEGFFDITLIKRGEAAGSGNPAYDKLNSGNGFVFEDLIPARPKRDDQSGLYESDNGAIKNILQVSELRGDNPANYQLRITMAEDPAVHWKLAKTAMLQSGTANPNSGKSRKPDTTDLYAAGNQSETLDSNFTEERENTWLSENFFLWNTGTASEWDHTKDLGLVPYRTVTVKKQDQAGTPLKGAKFSIYGPFATPSEAEIDPSKLVYPLTKDRDAGRTNEDGLLENLPELLYYQTYLLVEDEPAAGYTADGAACGLEAWTGDVPEGKAAWIIPNMYYVDDSEKTSVNTITVTDPYDTGTMTFEKTDKETGDPLAGAVFRLSWQYDPSANEGVPEANAEYMWTAYLTSMTGEDLPAGVTGVATSSVMATPSDLSKESVLVFETDGTGPVTLAGLPYGSYLLEETAAPEGYSQLLDKDDYRIGFVISKDHRDAPGTGEDPILIENRRQPYRLTLEKQTDYGRPIAGVAFIVKGPGSYSNGIFGLFGGLQTDEDTSRGVFTTGADGRLEISGLGFGDYEITEQSNTVYEDIDAFYVRIGKDGTVSLLTDAGGAVELKDGTQSTAEAPVLNLVAVNRPRTGSVTVEKVDSESHSRKLTGAEFRLTGQSTAEGAFEEYVKTIWGEGIQVLTRKNGEEPEFTFRITGGSTLLGGTDGTGVITRLPYGEYTLTEIKAPDGYVLGDTPWSRSFTVSEAEDEVKFTDSLFGQDNAVENTRHQLTVTKVSSVNENLKLEGAKFILRAADGRYVVLKDQTFSGWSETEEGATAFVTDENGSALVKGLPQGTYTLLEVESPIGYYINSSIPSFSVGDSHLAVIVRDTPRGGNSGGGGGNNGGGSSGGGGGTVIEDLEVPLANLPDDNTSITILDEDVPLARLPKTGDFSKDHGLMALITAALAVFLLAAGRKKEEEEK